MEYVTYGKSPRSRGAIKKMLFSPPPPPLLFSRGLDRRVKSRAVVYRMIKFIPEVIGRTHFRDNPSTRLKRILRPPHLDTAFIKSRCNYILRAVRVIVPRDSP